MMNELLKKFLDNHVHAVGDFLKYCELRDEIDLNLKIADRFYEIAPDVWEQFKKEELNEQ